MLPAQWDLDPSSCAQEALHLDYSCLYKCIFNIDSGRDRSLSCTQESNKLPQNSWILMERE